MNSTSVASSAWVPPLLVDVAWFEPERAEARALVRAIVLGLYDLLQRQVPRGEAEARDQGRRAGAFDAALRPGVGIPLLLGRPLADIAREVAERPRGRATVHAIVVLLAEGSPGDGVAFEQALRELAALASATPDAVLLLPVALHPGWLERPGTASALDMSAAPALDAAAVCREVAVELALRGLGGSRERVSLFVSHTAFDRNAAEEALRRIRGALDGDPALSRLFAVGNVRPDQLAESLRRTRESAMLMALRTDHFAESARCEEEVLVAKQRGIPVVAVQLLGHEERRSPPYGANMLNVVWRAGAEQEVLGDLLRVWLHHLHFRPYGLAVARLVGLAVEPLLISRPPELLDFAQGAIPSDRGALVLYPDPPLPTVETGVLQRAYPRVRLVTPTTLSGCVLRPGHPIPPLAGKQVSLSLSASPDVPVAGEGSHDGLTTLHLGDLIAHLTLCLVRAGARLAYGGHLKREGYTEALHALIRAHNQLGLPPTEAIRSYVAAYLKGQVEIDLSASPVWVGAEVAGDDAASRAVQLGRMRARMAEDGDALVAVGGKTTPRSPEAPDGYVGRFPGILEEAWYTLSRGKPLFVIGGFGGAARWVAELLLGRPPTHPELLDEARLRGRDPEFEALCRQRDAHPSLAAGEPGSLGALIEAIRGFGEPLRTGGDDALWTNGLSIAENRRLFGSQSPAEIAHLVMKGLLRRAAETARQRVSEPGGRPAVRVYHGHAADAPGVGAYAMTVARGDALAGEALLLDERMGGSIAARLSRGELREVETLPAQGQRLAGDWVYVVPTARPSGEDGVVDLAAAARVLVNHATSHGPFDLALVSWGLSAGVPVEAALEGLLAALRTEPNAARLTLTLCEAHAGRHAKVLRYLQERAEEVSLVVLPGDPALAVRPSAAHPVTVCMERIHDKLRVSWWAPADDAGPLALCREWEWREFEAFARELRRPRAPAFDELDAIGARLASFALPADRTPDVDRFGARPLDIVHDVDTSGLPWEALRVASRAEGPVQPGLRGGIRRRLTVDAGEVSASVGTASETRRVLLIVNPRADLAGAAAEGDALVQQLSAMPGLVVEVLRGAAATVDAVTSLLEQPWDVLHYAGHAYFNSPLEGQSGLVLAGGNLTAEHVKQLGRVPPFIFLNACQSARIRDFEAVETAPEQEPEDVGGSHGALARTFLTAGARLFIGNLWRVGDEAARVVARVTYEQLLKGASVGAALIAARQQLFAAESPDWANYVLYGDAAWQW